MLSVIQFEIVIYQSKSFFLLKIIFFNNTRIELANPNPGQLNMVFSDFNASYLV